METFLTGGYYILMGALFLFSTVSFMLFVTEIFHVLDKTKGKIKKEGWVAHWSWKDIIVYDGKELLIYLPGFLLFIYFIGILFTWIEANG